MKKQKIDCFIIPHSDEYLSEYIPPENERLAWATGFTGSAGLALITLKTGAIFVDGRYTVQVKEQVDSNLYELNHIKDNLVYKDEVIKMSKYIDSLVDKLPKVGNSEKLKEMIEWIRDEKSISKKNLIERLNWGVGIKFTQYRRSLLTNPNIFDTISENPEYCWKE